MPAKPIRWKRKGSRMFRFSSPKVTGIIFGSEHSSGWWGWGVWGSHLGKEGVTSGLRSARKRANEAIEAIEMAAA